MVTIETRLDKSAAITGNEAAEERHLKKTRWLKLEVNVINSLNYIGMIFTNNILFMIKQLFFDRNFTLCLFRHLYF